MLEILGLIFVVLAYCVWAGLKMDPPLEPARRNFLAMMLMLTSGAAVGFGRLSASQRLSPTEELTGRYIKNKKFRITNLIGHSSRIESKFFEDCIIYGPAVLYLENLNMITYCDIGTSLDYFFGEFPATQKGLAGSIILFDCQFTRCTFNKISVVGPPDQIKAFKEAVIRTRQR